MKILSILTCVSCIAFTGNVFSGDMSEPYKSIVDLPFDDHGWFVNHDHLKQMIAECDPKIVIEIGSWMGLSTRFIAENIDGVVYAIDTWKGSKEDAHRMDPRLPRLYQIFLSNTKHAGLTDKIIPIRMDSQEASQSLNIKADLIYIDGAHDTFSVYYDILAWNEHLSDKGIICGDDWSWSSVRDGVIMASHRLGKNIHACENFWRLH